MNKRSPTYIGSIALFLAHDYHISHFHDIAAVVRNGGSLNEGNMGGNDPIWVEFARHMKPAAMSARGLVPMIAELGRPMEVLDIAAGPGRYGTECNPAAEISPRMGPTFWRSRRRTQ